MLQQGAKYELGCHLPAIFRMIGDQTSPLNVYVKDGNNKPISNAFILVTPGVSAVTDASGFTVAQHKQQPGEYIEVSVQARGYKDQQKRVLVGTAQGNAITRLTDVVKFTLDKGENDRTVLRINVEVLDAATDKPVTGAKVKVKLSDGNELNAVTNAKGEAMISDNESYEGVTVKVMVSHPGYTEKWNDVPPELLTAKNSDTRLFIVFLDAKAQSARWAGNWIFSDNKGTVTLGGSGSAVTGNTSYADADWKSENTISGCQAAVPISWYAVTPENTKTWINMSQLPARLR